MVLESTMICVDNSDYMRNADFAPTRLMAQQDAVVMVCHAKTRANPENNVGLMSLANVELLVGLTNDVSRIMIRLQKLRPQGDLQFHTGIRIAHLALKHRLGKNHKMRVVAFIGSPILDDEQSLVKLAKKLKKEKVNVDVISFGEELQNAELLTAFMCALNGKDGTGSHLVTISSGPMISDALLTSPVIQADADTSGGTYSFAVDEDEDPELALALRISLEEERQRLEARTKRKKEVLLSTGNITVELAQEEDALMEQALAMSLSMEEDSSAKVDASVDRDFSTMTEEQQVEFAMNMSLNNELEPVADEAEAMDMDPAEEYADILNNPEFLQNILDNLDGVEVEAETTNDDRKKEDGNKKDKDSKK